MGTYKLTKRKKIKTHWSIVMLRIKYTKYTRGLTTVEKPKIKLMRDEKLM